MHLLNISKQAHLLNTDDQALIIRTIPVVSKRTFFKENSRIGNKVLLMLTYV
jgi:hypothetical protein